MNEHKSARNGALDFVKIIATIFIVFHHYQQFTGVFWTGGKINYCGDWLNFGYVTELFFMISGFLVYKYADRIAERKITLANWYVKKASRLLPLVAITVPVYEMGLVYYHRVSCEPGFFLFDFPVNLFGSVITMLGLQTGYGFENPYINSPTWYISILLACFIVFYAVTALAKKINCSSLYLYIAVILLGNSQLSQTGLPFLTDTNARGYAPFFIGVILAWFISKHGVTKITAMAGAAVFALVMAVFFYRNNIVAADIRNVLVFLLYPAIIIMCESGWAKRLFCAKIWGVLGAVTFNVYLWHCPIMLYWYAIAGTMNITPNFSDQKLMYMYTIVSFAVGAVSHFVLERPIDKVVQSAIRKKNLTD